MGDKGCIMNCELNSRKFYEYKSQEFLKILPLYKKSKYQIPMIQSVIEGKLEGRILADNEINPETVVVITNFNWIYVIGNQESEKFKELFYNFIINELTVQYEHFAWFGLSEYWQQKLSEVLGDEVRSFPRVKYEFCGQDNKKLNTSISLSDQYKVELIDKSTIHKVSEFFDGIKMFWKTDENFLKNSFGFCMLHVDKVISVCQALAITEDVCEVDILTDEKYRGKGLAYFTCRAFIEHCLKLGLKPYWETVRANKSSCRIAEKLGFVETEEYPFYAWFKNK